jgi:hypothetical protein
LFGNVLSRDFGIRKEKFQRAKTLPAPVQQKARMKHVSKIKKSQQNKHKLLLDKKETAKYAINTTCKTRVIEEVYLRTGAKVVVGSVYEIENKSYVVKSSQQEPEHEQDLIINQEATSIRQPSELGMRMIGGSFPSLKDLITYKEEGDRMIL